MEPIPKHKVDAHVHIMTDRRVRGGIRWVRQVSPEYENLSLDITTEELIGHLREEGIEAFYNFFYPLKPGEALEINRWQRNFADKFPEAVPFASLDPGDEDKPGIIKEALDQLDLAGFKFHPYIQGFDLLDPRMIPVYEELNERRTLTVIHTGFSEWYRKPSMVEACRTFLERYPKITTVLAHMLYMDVPVAELPVWLDNLPQLYLDVSNIVAYAPVGTWRGDEFQELIKTHSSRMLYGSDFPMGTLYPTGKLHRLAAQICPDQESLDNLMWRTASQLANLHLK